MVQFVKQTSVIEITVGKAENTQATRTAKKGKKRKLISGEQKEADVKKSKEGIFSVKKTILSTLFLLVKLFTTHSKVLIGDDFLIIMAHSKFTQTVFSLNCITGFS